LLLTLNTTNGRAGADLLLRARELGTMHIANQVTIDAISWPQRRLVID